MSRYHALQFSSVEIVSKGRRAILETVPARDFLLTRPKQTRKIPEKETPVWYHAALVVFRWCGVFIMRMTSACHNFHFARRVEGRRPNLGTGKSAT
jgi:hypothetical protein